MKNHKLEKIHIYDEFLDGMSPEELIEWAGQYLPPNRELINPKFKTDYEYEYGSDYRSLQVWLEHWVPMTDKEIEKVKAEAVRRKLKKAEDAVKMEIIQRQQYEELKKKFGKE